MPTRILVVDDDPDLLALMVAAFERDGFETYSARNGHIAMQVFRARRPHLVVTDIVMPEKEGIETIGELKRETAPPKVIAISGCGRMGGYEFLLWAKQFGADEVLLKPFQMSTLTKAARLLLKDHLAAEHDVAPPIARQAGGGAAP